MGETVEVTIRVATTTGNVIRDGHCEAEFFRPGHDPDGSPDFSVPAVWDAAARGFVSWVTTGDGWEPGTWTVQGRIRANTPRGPANGLSDPFPLVLRA